MSQINNIGINGNNSPNHKPSINNNEIPSNSAKVQTKFVDSMTKAIIRYLDKNGDASKTDAEKSVFIAIGYKPKEENEYKSNQKEIEYFRRHHIMRNRDAIRTLRIKQIINNLNKQYPTYSTSDVLIHLTTKLNELYLPSPSPPPPIQSIDNKKNIETKESVTEKAKHIEINSNNNNDKIHKNVTIPSLKTKNNITCSHQFQCRNKNITKGKIKNYTINYRNNNDRNDRNINNKQKLNEKKQQQQQQFNRDVSPSQIHITLNDNNINTMSLKPKINEMSSESDNYSINKQGIGFKQGIGVNFIDKNIIYTNLVGQYPNRSKTSNIYTKPHQFYASYDDDVNQKIKLHKKSQRKKRKFVTNEIMNNFDTQQPPKKRTRINNNSVFGNKGRGRSKNKTIRGRGRGNKTRNKYNNLRRNNDTNHSSECFDDEEDERSDIDIHSTTNNSI